MIKEKSMEMPTTKKHWKMSIEKI